MNKITIAHEKYQKQTEEIREWLHANAGQGSSRFGGRNGHINHWLNGDDWLYYQEYTASEDETQIADSQFVFVFKDEKTATEFALRFA